MENFDIVAYVNATLKDLSVPVFFVAKKEINPPLVVFNVTSEKGYDFWENEEQTTKYKVTINIFARGNYIGIKKEIELLMKQAGFFRLDIPACIYLEDIDVYNQPMSFAFYEEKY